MLHSMVIAPRTATVLLAMATVLLASCTRYIDDARAVAGSDRSTVAETEAPQCEAVDAPLTTIPTTNDDEPVMKIPQPQGWVRSTMMDSELIRFVMGNQSLVKDDFAPNVVVTFESAPGIEDPSVVFEGERESLKSIAGASDLHVTEHTLCGLPAETVHFRMAAIGNVPPHPAISVFAVLRTGDTTYAASVTMQSTDPGNPTYQRDSEMILTGFQLLPPERG
jgi:hypothetical protein